MIRTCENHDVLQDHDFFASWCEMLDACHLAHSINMFDLLVESMGKEMDKHKKEDNKLIAFWNGYCVGSWACWSIAHSALAIQWISSQQVSRCISVNQLISHGINIYQDMLTLIHACMCDRPECAVQHLERAADWELAQVGREPILEQVVEEVDDNRVYDLVAEDNKAWWYAYHLIAYPALSCPQLSNVRPHLHICHGSREHASVIAFEYTTKGLDCCSTIQCREANMRQCRQPHAHSLCNTDKGVRDDNKWVPEPREDHAEDDWTVSIHQGTWYTMIHIDTYWYILILTSWYNMIHVDASITMWYTLIHVDTPWYTQIRTRLRWTVANEEVQHGWTNGGVQLSCHCPVSARFIDVGWMRSQPVWTHVLLQGLPKDRHLLACLGHYPSHLEGVCYKIPIITYQPVAHLNTNEHVHVHRISRLNCEQPMPHAIWTCWPRSSRPRKELSGWKERRRSTCTTCI